MIKIYLYTNLITNKPCYVGKTKLALEQRAGSKGINYKHCFYFWNEIQKYNWENFKSEILTETDDDEYATLMEWFYTIEFNTTYPNGCNNSCGYKHSEESKKKTSNSLKGRPLSEEHKRKIGEAQKNNTNVRGRTWYTNGIKNTIQFECPKGYWKGRVSFH